MANVIQNIISAIVNAGAAGSSKTPASQKGGSSGNAAPSASMGSAKATSTAYKTSTSTGGTTKKSGNTGGGTGSSSNGRTAKSSARENHLANYDVKSAVEKVRDIVDSLGSESKNKLVGYDMLEWQADEAQSKAKNAEKNYYDALKQSGYDAGDAKVKSAKQMLDDALREAKIYTAASQNAPQLVSDRTSERVVDTAKGGAMDWAASIVNMAGAAYEGGARGAESQNETEISDLQQRLANAQEMYDNAVVKYNGDTENPNVKAAQATINDIQRDINVRQNIDYGKLEPISQRIYDKADNLSAKAAENIASAKEGLGKGGQLAVDAGVAGTQLLLDAASGRLFGGGSVPLLARSFGGGALEARNAGSNYVRQALYGIANAVAEAGTEKLFDGLAGIYGKGIVKSGRKTEVKNAVLQKLTQTEAGQKVLSILKGMGGEAAEEVIADFINPAIQAIYNGQSIGQNYSELEAADVVYDAIIGAVLGGAGSVVSAASTQGVQNAQNATAGVADESTPATEQTEQNGAHSGFNLQKTPALAPTEYASKVIGFARDGTQPTPASIEERRAALDARAEAYAERVARDSNNPEVWSELAAEGDAIDAEERAIRALETQQERVNLGQVSKAFGTETNHIDQRTSANVAKPSVKAFQFDHPELHEYYAETAKQLMEEVQTAKAESFVRTGKKGGARLRGPVERLTGLGMTKPRIMQCLNDIVQNNGAENYADAKRVEIVLNDMLTNGWAGMNRKSHEPNAQYIAKKDAIAGGVKADSWEKYLADHSLSLATGEATEEQIRAEWEAQNAEKSEPQGTTENKGETVAIIDRLKESIPELESEAPVSNTTTDRLIGIPGKTMAEKARALFKEVLGTVSRPGLGEVEINNRSIKDDLSHGVGIAKAAVIPAIPDVIKSGKQIDFQTNWKGRPYDGYVFAAPIELDGRRVYVAAIVKQTSKNHFYLHEVVDSDGNIIKINSGERANQTDLTSVDAAGTPSPLIAEAQKSIPAEAVASDNSIPTSQPNVNNNAAPTTAETTMGRGPERERGGSVGIRTNENNETELRESFEANPEYYTQLTNAEVIEKANAILAKGEDAARNEVIAAVTKAQQGMKLAPEYVVAAQEVANALTRQGKVDAAHELEAAVIAELTAAGQLGQIGRLIRTSPANVERGIQKALDKVSQEAERKGFDWKAELTDAEKTLIRNTDFKQPGAYEAVYSEIAERVGKEMPSTVWEKLQEVRRINMLLRPRTAIKNAASNVPMMGVRKLSEGISAAIQSRLVESGKMDASQQTRAKANEESKAIARNYWNANAKDIMRQGNRWDLPSMLREHRTVFKGGALEAVASKITGKEFDSFAESLRQVTYDMLERGDAPFMRSAFVDSLAQYCSAHGITDGANIPQAAIDLATANALEATYKSGNTLAKALNELKRKVSPATAAAIDIILPFTTTPANILSLMGTYSPVGFAKLLSKDSPAAKIDAFSKSSVGTLLIATGFLLRGLGAITGGEDEDKDKAAFDRATGRGTYSIGGRVSYDWAQPIGSLIALGAEISDALEGQQSWDSAVMNAIYTAGDSVLNMSLFQNVLSVLKGSGKPTQQIIDAIMEGGATQFIPGLAGDIARILDDTVRSTYTGGNVIDDIIAKATASTPLASKTLPESVNVKGEANTRGNLGMRILNQFINPTTITLGTRNSQDEEINRLYEATGSKTHYPAVSPYKIEYNSKAYTMNGEERAQFQRTQGKTYYEYAEQAMESTFYKSLDDKQKQAVLTEINSYALDAAKREFVEGRGDKYNSSASDTAATVNLADYLSAGTAYNDVADPENNAPNYAAMDNILASLGDMDRATRDKLDEQSGFKGLRFAHEVYGANSQWATNVRKLVDAEQGANLKGKNSAASDAAVIAKSIKGSDAEKIAALETMNLPYADTGKRASIVRRFEAAQAMGVPFDEWSKIESYIDATKTSDTPDKATIVAAGEKFGYSGSQVYSIYKKYPYDEEIVDITNDYFNKDYVEPEGVDLYYYLTGEKAPDKETAEKTSSGYGRIRGGRSSRNTNVNLGDSVAAAKSIVNKSTSTGNTDYLNRVLRDVIAANNRQAAAKPTVNWETLLAQYINPIK